LFPIQEPGDDYGEMLVRVNFRFPDGDEVRYLQRAPSLDSVIHGHRAEWVVTDVDLDTTGGYTIGLRKSDKRSIRRGRREN
jgi:hypothetical protein